MSAFGDYVARQISAAMQGAGEVARAGMADIGDSYQEILTGHSAISAPDGLTATPGNAGGPKPEAPVSDRHGPDMG